MTFLLDSSVPRSMDRLSPAVTLPSDAGRVVFVSPTEAP